MSGAYDWLAVGDVAEERTGNSPPILGGGAARLAAHAAALKASVALVGKVGDDEAGRRVREALERLRVDIRWLDRAPGMRTTVWHDVDGRPQSRRLERGADLALRLDELPPARVAPATLTVVGGYSLSVEPARSAAIGALTSAKARGGRAALLIEAELLWWTNARMTRRVLEPALEAADSVALRLADARVLVGDGDARQAARSIAAMGPRVVYLADDSGGVVLQEGSRQHHFPMASAPTDRYAGPAAFWVGLARGSPPTTAVPASLRYVQSVRRAGAPRLSAHR
jgi:sugar/nucleoside kinase (ribokinase family)